MTAQPANLPYLAPRLRSVPTMPAPIPPAVWAQMSWLAREKYQSRVVAAQRAACPAPAAGESIWDDRDRPYTPEEQHAAYRAYRRWRAGGPELSETQMEAVRAHRRARAHAKRSAEAAGATTGGDEVEHQAKDVRTVEDPAAGVPAGPAESVEPPPSRFDPMFADPEFWHDLAGQCAVYRRHAPASFVRALTLMEEGSREFLAAMDGAS